MPKKRPCPGYVSSMSFDEGGLWIPWRDNISKKFGRAGLTATYVYGIMWMVKRRHGKNFLCDKCHVMYKDIMRFGKFEQDAVGAALSNLRSEKIVEVASGGRGMAMSYTLAPLQSKKWFKVHLGLFDYLSHLEAVVWASIYGRQGGEFGVCLESKSNMAKRTGLSVISVRRCIKSMLKDGMLFEVGGTTTEIRKYKVNEYLAAAVEGIDISEELEKLRAVEERRAIYVTSDEDFMAQIDRIAWDAFYSRSIAE